VRVDATARRCVLYFREFASTLTPGLPLYISYLGFGERCRRRFCFVPRRELSCSRLSQLCPPVRIFGADFASRIQLGPISGRSGHRGRRCEYPWTERFRCRIHDGAWQALCRTVVHSGFLYRETGLEDIRRCPRSRLLARDNYRLALTPEVTVRLRQVDTFRHRG